MVKRDRIYKREFDKIIKKTLGITSKERAYLDESFASRLVGGLTVEGLRYKIGELQYSKDNIVSHHRLDVIRTNIIAELNKEENPVPAKTVVKNK
jgi:hypothetical protein